MKKTSDKTSDQDTEVSGSSVETSPLEDTQDDTSTNKNEEEKDLDSTIENTKETVKNKALEKENGQVPVETPASSNSEIPMMQFSVINIDSRTMRYRIPTNVINSSDVQINSTSQLITYQNNSEYTKSRALLAG